MDPVFGGPSPHPLFTQQKLYFDRGGVGNCRRELSLDDEVLKFFPEDAPANPTNNLKAMRVHDLLRMSTGHQTEPRLNDRRDEPWTKIFLEHPVPHKPGTHFLYNTAGTYMQSAIVQKATGQTVLDYLRPRLFEPLGIENPRWGTSPQGISLGGYGLDLRTEDIAKFGQLLLQKGKWQGRQLIPETWVEAATSLQTSNGSNPKSDWDQGYGYQFWRCRHGAFRGDGAFGQFCIVLPEQDAVIAITSGTRDMQAVLNVVWDKLLPAFHDGALDQNPVAYQALQKTLAALELRGPKGSSEPSPKLLGKTFHLEANNQKLETIAVREGENGTALHLRVNGADYTVPVGYQAWSKGRLGSGALPEQPVAARGAWQEDGSYSARICFIETPTYLTIKLTPAGDGVTYDAEYNVAFGPAKQPQIQGHLR